MRSGLSIGGTWRSADGFGKTLRKLVDGWLVALVDRGFEAGMDTAPVEVIDSIDGGSAPTIGRGSGMQSTKQR